ncbi:MAG: AAA family ATPase [Actinomycetota bacterium]
MGAELIGRRTESGAVSAFVRDATAGAVLLLRGEAGIGKSTLWRAGVADAASARRVLRADAAAAETALRYAVLADLLRATPLDPLPPLQRDALAAVLAGGDADPRAVAAGTRALLAALAQEGPVLVSIDDAHWTDAPSAAALGFALRRLDDENVAVLLAARSDAELPLPLVPERTTTIEVTPLSRGALHHLINERTGQSWPRPFAHRVHALSGGNPFYALEIAGRARDGVPALPDSLLSLVDDRFAALSGECLAALRVVALAESPTWKLVDTVVSGGAAALDDAVACGLVVETASRLRFTHPLYAEGVVASSSPSALRAVHSRLAQLAPASEVAARHAALAATGPDEATAARLEQAARDVFARENAPLAAELAGHALALSDGPPVPERVMLAAETSLVAGDLARARTLLLEALDVVPPGDRRARVLILLSDAVEEGTDMLERYCEAAVAEAADPALRADALSALAGICALGRVHDLPRQRSRVDEAHALCPTSSVVETNGLWVKALGGDAVPPEPTGDDTPFLLSPRRARGLALLWDGRLDEARAVFAAGVEESLAAGEDESLTAALLQQAELESRAGWVERARRVAADAALGAPNDSQGRSLALRIRAAASLPAADPAETCRLAQEAAAIAAQGRFTWQELEARRIAGAAALLGGDVETALRELGRVREHLRENGIANPGAFPVAGDLAETLVHAGRPDEADALAEELAASGNTWATVVATRVHGFLSGDDEQLEESAERARALGLRLDEGRALLLLGVARRRSKRRGAAREAFARAERVFAELGASQYTALVRREAARLGGRTAGGRELSATERRVAELVAAGYSNREVAAAVSLSVRGVEASLSRIYTKLGIRSRTQLAAKYVDLHISPEPPAS